MRLDRCAEQRRSHQPAAGRHQDPGFSHPVRVAGPGAPDEPRVVDRRAERVGGMERLLEGREAGVRMDEQRVEVLVREPSGPVVMPLLVAPAAHQDVAEAAGHERGRAGGVRGLEQRHQLGRELLAAEREQLDEEHVGGRLPVGLQDHRPAEPDRLLDREPLVTADQRVVRVQPERGQVHDLDGPGLRELAGPRAAVQERDVEVPGQAVGQVHRAHQVPEPHRVLAVEQQSRSPHGRPSARSSVHRSAVASTCSRTASVRTSTRWTARAARSTRSAAAAYQSRSRCPGAGP